jgi:pimeloyl-ACP methyl ester carboxylesterase
LRNRWLLGNAGYRRPGASGPVDTVYLGAFRREELLELGGYDERLDANEDFEVCGRYLDAGRVVWLEEDLLVNYEPRVGTAELFAQYQAFGEAKVAYWRATGHRPNRRQLLALGLAGGGALAMLASLRRPRRAAALVAAGVVGVALIDHLAEPHEPDPQVRARACVASVATTTGWLWGVVRGLLR